MVSALQSIPNGRGTFTARPLLSAASLDLAYIGELAVKPRIWQRLRFSPFNPFQFTAVEPVTLSIREPNLRIIITKFVRRGMLW